MTDAAKVQVKPVSTEDSQDVLDDLLVQQVYDVCGILVPPRVAEFLKARVAFGEAKYGSRLKTHNGRDVVLDIKQELGDGIMYSHQAAMQGIQVRHIRNGLIAQLNELLEFEEKHGKS